MEIKQMVNGKILKFTYINFQEYRLVWGWVGGGNWEVMGVVGIESE